MKQLFFTITLVVLAQTLVAQAPAPQLWSGRLDFFHQDYISEFSFGQLGVYDPVYIRPGVRVGVERSWVTKNHFRLYQDLMVGYYHNTYDERSWTLGTDLGVEWRIFKQFRLGLPLGLHYNNVKAIDVRYAYVGDKWVKAKNTDPAIHRLQVQLGLNIGWRFLPTSAHPIDLFANANLSAIGPWEPNVGVPFLIYKAAGLGVRVGI